MKRIGIVGVGGMGMHHLQCWKQLPVEIMGVYDPLSERAAKAAQECGGQACSGLAELVDQVDVVDVCTPTPFHKEAVLAAAAAGKHVVCEKPLARHLADAEQMVAACEAAGVRLFVAHVVRFFRQFSQAKALLDAGTLGRPGVIRTVRGGSAPSAPDRCWFLDFAHSGGVIMDLSIHDIDFARWCCGDVERVFARGLTFADTRPNDHALIVLRFKNGAIGHIEGSWAFPAGAFHTAFEIATDQGMIEYDSLNPAPLTVTVKPTDAPQAAGHTQSLSPLAEWDDPYYQELAHFLDCLDSGEEFRVTAHDALEAVRVSLAAIESMRTGQPVELDTFTA
ncbi:MAG: Gfo/Idh/MocA family oxidoreductase [Anaerolineales bacterium]|nr:Gfo/Idh/MocA family oxidoreductase [Anaerolineales bacterium]